MPFSVKEVDFSISQSIPGLVSDYLGKKDSLKSFYNGFPEANGFRTAIENRKLSKADRQELVEVLAGQNPMAGPLVTSNIESLLHQNTFTITTGHQLNLFTGPLYFIYKILSAIKLAQSLNKEYPQNHFVPVYWMASEDHDLEEIDHTYVYGKQVKWNIRAKGVAGKVKCEGMSEVIASLKAILGESERAKSIVEILTVAYAETNSLSAATRILADKLFSKYGLVILDADDSRLKKIFAPVIKEELIKQVSFQKAGETIKALEKDGYEVQVQPREINLFYLSENSRERIVKENGVYKVLNSVKEWNEAGILKELDEYPERFSPNVVLRPLYQEAILPNIAYVGGPAEIAYWFEYKGLFDHFQIRFPLLVLRNCALLIDEGSAERMNKLQITIEDLFKSYNDLAREFISRNSDSISLKAEVSKISDAFDSMIQKAGTLDATLAKATEAEKQKQLNALGFLEEKITRAEKKKHEISLQQIQKLKEKFFPGGSFQERHENFIPYYLKYGELFFDLVLESFHPVTSLFLVIAE